ncbi:MAG: ABC transporter ATP-binding protein [Acidobacteria bacterium]|nr:ABC transporter ATP-binding protein [Acidobacteriota bacterium]
MIATGSSAQPILEVHGLSVNVYKGEHRVPLLQDVSLQLVCGETLGLVGRSGSGKTTLALSIMRLLDAGFEISSGEILFKGQDLLRASSSEMRRLWGRHISMVFQEPYSALNPLADIGTQIGEVMQEHLGCTRAQARQRAAELLCDLDVDQPELRLRQYPHQLSGGQRQRALIAAALAGAPEILIADEPTTALDPVAQIQILNQLRDCCLKREISLLLISHDIPAVVALADFVVVMETGSIIEAGPVAHIIEAPMASPTKELLQAARRFSKSAILATI